MNMESAFVNAQTALLDQTWTIHRASPLITPLSLAAIQASLSRTKDMDAQWLVIDNEHDDDSNTLCESSFAGEATVADNVAGQQNPIKRQRIDKSDDVPKITSNMQHLRLRHHADSKISATVVFCFAKWTNDEISKDPAAIQRFEFCVVRGAKSCYESIFCWMEQISGNHMNRRPVSLPPSFLANMLYDWLVQMQEQTDRSLSSVEFKFAPPASVQGKNVTDVLCAFTPTDLYALCQLQMEQEAKDENAGKIAALEQQPLLLRAVYLHARATMCIRLQYFMLTQVTWEAAALGSGGHVKPKCGKSLASLLKAIGSFVAGDKE
ncbi:hypothetical protein MPSEU_001061900 [Mayamaea pseudoterrestris]|nr:hypothetical protein MPSEU_001061900 [Mayamaea pseudoterrestris]